ncbi:REP-associated tyrosine transposase [Lysobacter antibioticus]|uniref:REP-associated tyrosine transposase n=1 Tax=Lysobacter antibioticus TaxID=84531 RepID=UPI000ADCCC97
MTVAAYAAPTGAAPRFLCKSGVSRDPSSRQTPTSRRPRIRYLRWRRATTLYRMTPSPPRPPGHAALRRGRCSETQGIYLVTSVTDGRRALFADPRLATAATDALLDMRLWPRSRLLAWVLMPDHWHGLVELGAWETLPDLMRRLKSNTARQVRFVLPLACSVWAPAYHDRALRHDDCLLTAARYLVANPLRAGLVRRVGDYPHWGALWIEGVPPTARAAPPHALCRRIAPVGAA